MLVEEGPFNMTMKTSLGGKTTLELANKVRGSWDWMQEAGCSIVQVIPLWILGVKNWKWIIRENVTILKAVKTSSWSQTSPGWISLCWDRWTRLNTETSVAQPFRRLVDILWPYDWSYQKISCSQLIPQLYRWFSETRNRHKSKGEWRIVVCS